MMQERKTLTSNMLDWINWKIILVTEALAWFPPLFAASTIEHDIGCAITYRHSAQSFPIKYALIPNHLIFFFTFYVD